METATSEDCCDFQFENHGGVVLCFPQNDVSHQHLEDTVDEEASWFGRALAIEPRYLSDLVSGLRGEGFVCNG